MKTISILVCAIFVLSVYASSAAQHKQAEAATKLLITLCVDGGVITITKSTESNSQYEISGEGKSIVIEKKEAIGVVEGINNKINSLVADQANKIRDCMKPYIGRLMNLTLEDEESDPNELVTLVSNDVTYQRAPPSSQYDWIAGYSYIYKNRGASTFACRFIATGVLRNKDEKRTLYKTFEKNIKNCSLQADATYEADGKVGVTGFNDDDHVVSVQTGIDCW